MLKNSIRNYFQSLKHFFTPLGTMFLGMMIGISILIPGIIAAATELASGIEELAEHVNLDFELLWQNLWNSVTALDWNDPLGAFQTLLSPEWIHDVLTQELSAILGTDFETFTARIAELVGMFTASVFAYIFVFFLFWVLGFIAGFILIRFLIRRSIARRSIWKFVLSTVISSVLSALLVGLCLWVYTLWQSSIYISFILILLLVGVFAFLQAYLLYGIKKVRFADVVNLKNIGLYFLSNVIIFFVSVLFTLIAVAINSLMGLFVGLSIIEIAIIVVSLNAESYVQSLASEADSRPKPLFTPAA